MKARQWCHELRLEIFSIFACIDDPYLKIVYSNHSKYDDEECVNEKYINSGLKWSIKTSYYQLQKQQQQQQQQQQNNSTNHVLVTTAR